MPADVCLILEGSWPYVPGGVATWVQQLLGAMPDLRFTVLYLGSTPDAARQPVYALPGNVDAVTGIYLHDLGQAPADGRMPTALTDEGWAAIDACQRCLAEGAIPDLAAVCAVLDRFRDGGDLLAALAHSPQAWNLAVQHYLDSAPHAPFLHHFWTGRFINTTVLGLLRHALPEARVYHAVGAGYAGLLGAKARQVLDRPFILSEHGIYQRERRIELFDAAWVRGERPHEHLDLRSSRGAFKDWWAQSFRALARTAYAAADIITARSDVDRTCQIADGAEAARCTVVPPGLDLTPFAGARSNADGSPLRIGVIGPLIPGRDAVSVLQALAFLHQRRIPFTATFIGPPDEGGRHAADCRELATGLGLAAQVAFAGRAPVLEHYPRCDVVVAASLVEEITPTVLEACAAGLPVVASDVGACREVLLGRSPEDRGLGPAGLVVPPAAPAALADALVQLAGDAGLRRTLGAAGRERTRRYYDQRDAAHRFQELYAGLLTAAPASA